jgi:hypothetical protein
VKKPERPRPANQFRFARHGAPIGMIACFEDGARAGRVVDVIVATESGQAVAYEVIAPDGRPRYLPASALVGQKGDTLRFATSARNAPRELCDVPCLPEDDAAATAHEFAVLESFEHDMQDRA